MADFDGVASEGHPEPRGRRDPRLSWVTRKALVMGTSGQGKTTVVNMVFNDGYGVDDCKAPGKVGNQAGAVTLDAEVVFVPLRGFLLCDSRGLGDPGKSNMQVFRQARSVFKILEEGVTALIVVARFGRWTELDLKNASVEFFDKCFKSSWRQQSILVLTNYDGQAEDKATDLQAWYATSPKVESVVKSFAHVIMTDNNTKPGYEELTREKRRLCLHDLNEKIGTWSEPIKFGIIGVGDFIEVVFQQLRAACLNDKKKRDAAYRKFEAEYGEAILGQCSICMEVITASSSVVTKCGHAFHEKCLLDYVGQRFATSLAPCPYCQQPVTGFS